MTFQKFERRSGRPLKAPGLRVATTGISIALPTVVREKLGRHVFFQIDIAEEKVAVSKAPPGERNSYRVGVLGGVACSSFLRAAGMAPGWYPGELIVLNGVMSLIVNMEAENE